MKRIPYYSLIVAALFVLISACSEKDALPETFVEGTITVSDSLDDSGDYSDIGITILSPDTTGNLSDTLFNTTTDAKGNFSGYVQFPERRYYPVMISRNGRDLQQIPVILAENDSLNITMQLPDIRESLQLKSKEHEAMKTLNRVERSFQRVSLYARGGALSDSALFEEIKRWSDLYWEVYEKHENTLAAYMAAEKSADLLNSWNKEEMLRRIDEALPADYMIGVALNFGKPYIAESRGFEAAASYLDSLSQLTDNKRVQEVIERNKIQLYFDSSRVKEAKNLLAAYEIDYTDNSASKKWARRIRYDLNYLAPGMNVPNFNFITQAGDTVTNSTLQEDVYILEFSPLANAEYQNDYDRTLIIHEIYKNYGLKIFTIPLDRSEVTVNAFFEERRKGWPVAKIGTFDVQDFIQKFNVVQIPTRFLIDQDGVIIRKYERAEFEDVIQGLNRAFRNSNSPS
jgi:peroxiredoxin